jgi:hypothetical protein
VDPQLRACRCWLADGGVRHVHRRPHPVTRVRPLRKCSLFRRRSLPARLASGTCCSRFPSYVRRLPRGW